MDVYDSGNLIRSECQCGIAYIEWVGKDASRYKKQLYENKNAKYKQLHKDEMIDMSVCVFVFFAILSEYSTRI